MKKSRVALLFVVYQGLLNQKKYTMKELSNAKKGIEALENELISQKKEFNELKGRSNYLLIKNPKERKAYLLTELKNLKESKNVVDDAIININKDYYFFKMIII